MDTIYNRDGCFYRALDDEPVFVLLARDPCTPEAIRWWVTLRQALIGQGQKPLEDHAMLADALKTATDAHIWRQDATDPTKWRPERWHVEPAPERMLVPVVEYEATKAQAMGRVERASRADAAADGSTLGGTMLPYDEWQRVLSHPDTMRLGNRFLLGYIGVDLVFWENRNHATPEEVRDDWTGYYPVRHSLQKEMLELAYQGWRDGERQLPFQPRDITSLVDLPPEEGRPDSILRKRLEGMADTDRVTLSAKALRKVLRAMPFVAVDLAAKIATGLRQVIGDMDKWIEDNLKPKDSVRAKEWVRELDAFRDRLGGYAMELDEGSMIGKTLQSRPIAQRPFGIPDFEPPMTPAQAIETIGSVTGTVFDGEVMRPKAETDMVDVTELADMPPHRFAMFTKSEGWAYGRGLEINPSHIPAMLDRMEQDGYYLIAALGSQADKVGMVFRRRRLFELATGSDASVLSMPCGGEGDPPCGPAGMGRGLEP